MSNYVPAVAFTWMIVLVAAASVAFLLIADDDGEGGSARSVRTSPAATAVATSPGALPLFEIRMVPTLRFDRDEMRVQTGQITVRADNADGRASHNWAAYTDSSAEALIAMTEICRAPCVEEVTFMTPPVGEYFFRCDAHPTQMVGKFIVE
jgi:plastocyanin